MRSSKSRQLAGPTKKKILITLGMILIVLTSFFGGYFTQVALRNDGEAVVGDMMHIMDKVGFVYDSENDTYVKLDEDKIAQLIAGNFLDKYSAYYTEEEYKALQKEKSGNFTGFGLNMLNVNTVSDQIGTNVINSVALNSPAHNAGFKGGDKITKAVVGEEVYEIKTGKQLSSFFDETLLHQTVEFTIDRNGEEYQLECAKENYICSYVTYQDDENYMYFSPQVGKRMVDVEDAYRSMIIRTGEEYANPQFNVDTDGDQKGDIAYIRIVSFQGDVVEQFGAALQYMQERGRERLILDLCNNGGGSMSLLQDVATYLMDEENSIIAKASEKLDGNDIDGYFSDDYRTTNYVAGENNFNHNVIQIAILANRNTASASECLIGAMNFRGEQSGNYKNIYTKKNLVVVGSPNNYDKDDIPDDQIQYRTYGKGIVQTTYKLTSGGALKITTAKLLAPNNTCIHNKGIIANSGNGVANYQQALTRAVEILTPTQG